MNSLYEFFSKIFGLDNLDNTSWEFRNKLATDFTVMTLLAIIFTVIAVIFIITTICLAVSNSKKKKKLKDANLQDSGELRNKIRNEIEPIIRKEVELEYKEKLAQCGDAEQLERLKKRLDEKDAHIKELGKALEQANATAHAMSSNSNNAEISKTVSDLTLQNSLLTEQNNQYHNEISELQAEIAKLKEKQGKQQVAAQKAKQKAVEKAKADVTKQHEEQREKEKAAQEKAEADKAAKEAAEKAAKEIAEKAAKEAAEKAAKEAAEKAAKAAAEKTAKEVAKEQDKTTEEPKAAPKKTAKKKAATEEPKAEAKTEDNAEEDEYDNEFGDENSEIKVTLKFDRPTLTWVINRSDQTRTVRRLNTKTEALPIARDLAKRLHAQLVVYKMDGEFQV